MSLIRRADPRRGAAAVEFALLVPLLILLFGATAEIVIHIRTWFRLERTAAEVANVASQFDALDSDTVIGLFAAAKAIAAPVTAWTDGTGTGRARTLIGVVSGTATGNKPAWCYSNGDTGLVNLVAGKAALPNGFVVPNGQSILVVEVINAVTPWSIMAAPMFFGTVGPGPVRTYAIVRPRTATLTSVSKGTAALTSIGGVCP